MSPLRGDIRKMRKEQRRVLAQFRAFGTFEMIDNKSEVPELKDPLSDVVDYFGPNATGNKITDLIVGFSVYPDIDPEKLESVGLNLPTIVG